jgi:hypothetical protein
VQDLARIFNVHEDVPRSIRHGELRFSRHWDSGDHFVRGSINHIRVFARAVEDEDKSARGFEQNGVWILSNGHGRDRLTSGTVKDDDSPGTTVTDVTNIASIVESDTMSVLQAADFPRQLASLSVNDMMRSSRAM